MSLNTKEMADLRETAGMAEYPHRDTIEKLLNEIEQLQATVESFQWKPKPPTLPGWYLRRQSPKACSPAGRPPSDLVLFKQVTSFNGVLVTGHKERGKKKKLTPVDILPEGYWWLGPVPSLPVQEEEP